MAERSTTKKKVIGYTSEQYATQNKRMIPKLNLNGPSKKKGNQTFKNNKSITDENSALRVSLQRLDEDHRRMKKTLEETVAEAEKRLDEMKKLLDKREEIQHAQMEEFTKKNLNLEDQVTKYEKHLLSSNVDPVTLQTLGPISEDNEGVEEKRKFSKTRVKQMRERLRQMNDKTNTFLTDIQNMKQQLQELEDMGSRMEPIKDDDDDDDDDDYIPAPAPVKPQILPAVVSDANKSVGPGGDISQATDVQESMFLTEDCSDQT